MADDDVDVFMSRLNPDMCVVTAATGADRSGCLVGFSSQCSIDPVRYVVWISKANHTYGAARAAECLAVHLLTREQHGLAALFGGRTGDRIDKFAQVRWRPGHGGSVVLEEAAAWFVGLVEDRVDGGDHVGFVLRPVEWGERTDGPLLRMDDAEDITPGHPA
ncbi:flavin reductase family protein [Streptomyces sp. VMFN-G11Ma]|uniref:flavin reductase family protein n=1 Tax=Streptomyces sp. VMFN-G11Ma TaxID=2135609 RepID=UPI000D365B18|nr:flavin reductase family protein [Streptomyces sp. VMFN-G11Ma]PTM85394.1 flavin reductase (DIM6/NTAB) family NADH-FMN oxidoreductase RutF [Streptomyces sp. VMFN-G11Ma]